MLRIAFAAVLALAAFQQQQQPQQPPANMPGPIAPPKLLTNDNSAAPACKGVTPGEVKLQFTVSAEGVAKDIKVLASPSEAQGACARALVSAYQYVPAMQDGKPVVIQLILTIHIGPSN